MNDLQLLHQIDPNKKVISLEFKQITNLESMMPLLSKFENLESLSLHGNRIKSLPSDMSSLENLVELDLSNNLFMDIDSLIESLKTIPNLTHLLFSFKDQSEENKIKDELVKLQRLNKKVIKTHERTSPHDKRSKKQLLKLSEKDLENVGILYDEIRQIYRESKYLVDKELANDFDYNVQNIMSDMAIKLKSESSVSEKNCTIVCGKYALIDLCFVKLITYFYHFDKKIASCLQKIHDQQASMFKTMTELLIEEVNRGKLQFRNVKLQKQQLYKKQIKRVKSYQIELNKHIQNVEKQNRELLQKLMKYGKSNLLQNTIMKVRHSKSPKKHKTPDSARDNAVLVSVRKKPKELSIHQIKQLMNEIYNSKEKHNLACKNSGQIMETMEMHMYTYLNQKYGLKSLSVQWAISIVNGIRKHGIDDPEIGVFGKVLRNQVEESFHQSIKRIKSQFQEGVKKFKLNLSNDFDDNQISLYEAEQILLYMGMKRDQISALMSRIKDQKIINNFVTFQTLEKTILEFYVKKHDEKIAPLIKLFKEIDEDQDGIIDANGLESVAKKVNKNIDISQFKTFIDPFGTDVNTFSHVCECMLKHPAFKDFFSSSQ